MKKVLLSITLLLTAVFVNAQGTVTTFPPLVANNSQSGITCNLSASGVDIVIDSLAYVFGSGNATAELWYNTTPINGTPGTISAANGWISLGTWSVNGNNTSLTPMGGGINLTIPAGQTYGICLSVSGGSSLRYMTAAGGPFTFTDGTLTIETGANVGYGGFPSPTFHIRQFLGAFTYKLGIRGEYNGEVSAMRKVSTQAGSNFAGYVQVPFTQNPSYEFGARAANRGDSTITGIQIDMEVLGTTYTSSFTIDTLKFQEDSSFVFNGIFSPTSAGEYTGRSVISIAENDTIPDDDTAFMRFVVSDTILAREDSQVVGGIGNATPIEFGHMFELAVPDTLSTVSFYLNAPQVGTSVQLFLYTFSDTALNGRPGPDQLIDSTRVFTIQSATARWYTAEIGCGGHVLTQGKYFISVNQLNPINMSLGYAGFKAGTDTFLYINLFDTVGWRDAYHPTLNPLVQNITLLLRTNLGRVSEKLLFQDSAYYCNASSSFIKPMGVWDKFLWSNGSAQDSISVGRSGVYTLTVTDEIGCEYIDSLIVSPRPAIQYSSLITDANCGASDGKIVASASGSLAPYTFAWSTGAMNDSISGIAGGNYDVTVTDGFGCQAMISNLVLGKNPVISGSYTPPTCNGDADGKAKVSVVDGIPSYSYAWVGGAGSGDEITGLSAGAYAVTVTDSSNCSATITIDVINPDSLLVNTNNSLNPSNCGANDGRGIASVVGGLSPYSYFWSNGQNQRQNINLSTGTYDVTVTDALGCVRTASVTLIDPNAPSLTGNGSTVTCSEDLGAISVTVTGGTPPFQYIWDNGSSDSSQAAVSIGTYNVNVVDAAGCIKVAQAIVQGPDKMDVDFNVTYGPAGNGDSDVDAVISGANTPYANYQWKSYNGITTAAIANATTTTLSDALNGDYFIVVEDAQGCLDSAEVNVNNLSVGILQNNLSKSLEVYPNPSSGQFNISFGIEATNALLRILDAQGKVVSQQALETYLGQIFSLDLNGLSEGIYFVDLLVEDKHFVKKIQLAK